MERGLLTPMEQKMGNLLILIIYQLKQNLVHDTQSALQARGINCNIKLLDACTR